MTANLDNNIKRIGACVPDRDQSGSILHISSFLFNIDIVRHFNTVNNSDTAEAGHTRALDTCSCYHIRREASVSLIRQSVMPTARARVAIYESLLYSAAEYNQLEKLYTLGTPVARASCYTAKTKRLL